MCNATVSIAGTKTLENRTLAENEFKFFLYSANENYVVDAQVAPKEAKNNADGSFAFDALTFEQTGTYYFVITEDADTTAERVTNDTSVYHLAIEIKDDGNGKLYESDRVLKKVGSDNEITEIVFNNVYTPAPTPEPTPNPEYPDSPQTGDTTNLHLWFALLFVSGGGFIGTTLHSRKRKEEN